MRSIITSSLLLLCVLAPGLAAAQAAPQGPAPAPVVLPEEPDESAGASAAAGSGKDAAPPSESKTVAPPTKALGAPPAAIAPPGRSAAPPAAVSPPPQIAAAPSPAFAPAEPRPSAPERDSGGEKPRGPIHSRFNIAVNVDTVWYTGRSFDFFSEHNNATSPGVSLGYALWMDDPVSLVPEIGWSTNTVSEENLFGGAISHTELQWHNVYGGLSLRFAIISFLETHARVAGGVSFVDATVRTGTASAEFENTGVSPFGSVGAGFTVHSPGGALETNSGSFRTLVAGLTFEGGYQLGSALDITPTPTGDSGRIPTTYSSFGMLERSGPYLRTSLVLRF